MAQRQLYSGLDLYDWRGTGPNGRTKAVDVDKWQQNQEDIRHLPGAFPVQNVVITDGQITPTAAALSVDTEGGAPADDLTAIAPGDLHAGMLLALCSVDTGRKVTIKNSAGASGIQTLDGKDVVLDTQYAVMLRLVSTGSLTLWREEPGPLRLQLPVATSTTLGGVKVQTGDDDGLEMIGDKLRARQANSTQRGSVLASETAQSSTVPQAGADGKIANGWLPSILCNTREILTTSGTYIAPVSGWYRIELHGGGGAGGAGNTTNKSYGGGGGGSGGILVDYAYLTQGESYSYIIGAGGVAKKEFASGTGGDGGETSFTTTSGKKSIAGGFGGGNRGASAPAGISGGDPGPGGFPGGIAGFNTDSNNIPGGSGGMGVTAALSDYTPGQYGSGGAGGYSGQLGHDGVQGCIILDYFAPEKEAV